jgi:hypothetical protein
MNLIKKVNHITIITLILNLMYFVYGLYSWLDQEDSNTLGFATFWLTSFGLWCLLQRCTKNQKLNLICPLLVYILASLFSILTTTALVFIIKKETTGLLDIHKILSHTFYISLLLVAIPSSIVTLKVLMKKTAKPIGLKSSIKTDSPS